MATIITVHGTFATGEETGDKWWQGNSEVEKALRAFVRSAEGPLNYEALIWDGANSEMSRRDAARHLLKRMNELETAKEPYVVIGHSHGGSVIAFALQHAARKGNTLPHMRSWITVGTPFIATKPKQSLFSRADQMFKGVLIVGVCLLVAALYQLWRTYGQDLVALKLDTRTIQDLVLAAIALGYLFWQLPRWVEGRDPDWQLLQSQNIAAASRYFAPRWLQLWHPQDEAILLLRTVHTIKPNIFPRDVASSLLVWIFIASLPALAIGLAASRDWSTSVASTLKLSPAKLLALDSRQSAMPETTAPPTFVGPTAYQLIMKAPPAAAPSNPQQMAQSMHDPSGRLDTSVALPKPADAANPFALRGPAPTPPDVEKAIDAAAMREMPGTIDDQPSLMPLVNWFADVKVDETSFTDRLAMVVLAVPVLLARELDRHNVIWLMAPAAILFFGTMALFVIFRVLANAISIPISMMLNRMARSQLKGLSCGADVSAETTDGCAPHPAWSPTMIGALPPAVCAEIGKLSDAAAAKAVTSIRARASEIVAAEDFKQRLAEYLTWDELLHTTYFKSPLFLQLLAMAISRGEGFAPTAALAAEASHDRARGWLAEIDKRTPVPPKPLGRLARFLHRQSS